MGGGALVELAVGEGILAGEVTGGGHSASLHTPSLSQAAVGQSTCGELHRLSLDVQHRGSDRQPLIVLALSQRCALVARVCTLPRCLWQESAAHGS